MMIIKVTGDGLEGNVWCLFQNDAPEFTWRNCI